MSQAPDPRELYDRVGGHETFVALVRGFYEGVATDEPLRALYPEEDLAPAQERLLLFLEQYFGGPRTYSERRGHPRLRLRHMPFAVSPDMRRRWMAHMLASLDRLDIGAEDKALMAEYLDRAATMLVNTTDDGPAPGLPEGVQL